MQLKFREKLLILGLKGLGQLSLRTLYHLAVGVTLLLQPLPLRVKKTIARNLEKCFPELSTAQRQILAKKTLLHTIWRILEMPFFWFADLKTVNAAPIYVTGEETFRQDFNRRQGIIAFTMHFGAWEVLNVYFGQHYPSACLYKPFKQAYQEELLSLARARFGVEFFKATVTGVKQIFAFLQQGKCICALSDHDPGNNGAVMAPFFGLPSPTPLLLIKLIQKTQAPVYVIAAKRLPQGRGFTLDLKKMPDLHHLPPEQVAAQINAAFEVFIREAPEQYEWSYRRFRRTPTTTGKGFYE